MENKTVIIKKDGNMWCSHREDFINLQESDAGFGETEVKALKNLIRIEDSNFRKSYGLPG